MTHIPARTHDSRAKVFGRLPDTWRHGLAFWHLLARYLRTAALVCSHKPAPLRDIGSVIISHIGCVFQISYDRPVTGSEIKGGEGGQRGKNKSPTFLPQRLHIVGVELIFFIFKLLFTNKTTAEKKTQPSSRTAKSAENTRYQHKCQGGSFFSNEVMTNALIHALQDSFETAAGLLTHTPHTHAHGLVNSVEAEMFGKHSAASVWHQSRSTPGFCTSVRLQAPNASAFLILLYSLFFYSLHFVCHFWRALSIIQASLSLAFSLSIIFIFVIC